MRRFIASGQSAREFAEAEGVNPKSLSGYKSHFARQARARTPELVKVRVTSQVPEPSSAIEIVLTVVSFSALPKMSRKRCCAKWPEHLVMRSDSFVGFDRMIRQSKSRIRNVRGARIDPLLRGSRSASWAELLKKTFAFDVLRCPKCNGRMKALAMVTDPTSVARYVKSVDEATQPPARRASRSSKEGAPPRRASRSS